MPLPAQYSQFTPAEEEADSIIGAINDIAKDYVGLVQSLYAAKTEEEKEALEQAMKKHPRLYNARLAHGPMALARVIPTQQKVIREQTPQRLSPQQLKDWGIPVEKLKEMAAFHDAKTVEGDAKTLEVTNESAKASNGSACEEAAQQAAELRSQAGEGNGNHADGVSNGGAKSKDRRRRPGPVNGGGD